MIGAFIYLMKRNQFKYGGGTFGQFAENLIEGATSVINWFKKKLKTQPKKV